MEIKQASESALIDDYAEGFGKDTKQDFDFLINKLLPHNPDADVDFLKSVFAFAVFHHRNQYRKSGQRYYVHLLWVALFLIERFKIYDEIYIAAALLHDTIEDTQQNIQKVSRDLITRKFGNQNLALAVEALTKISNDNIKQDVGLNFNIINKIQANHNFDDYLNNKTIQKGLTYCKLFMTFVTDPNVIVIKLSDRLHNMKTLQYFEEGRSKEEALKKQRAIASETMQFYVGFAYRLGYSDIANELIQLSFRYLSDSNLQKEIRSIINQNMDKIMNKISIFESRINNKLLETGLDIIKLNVYHRPDYEIYNLTNKLKNLNAIKDFVNCVIPVPKPIDIEFASSIIASIFPTKFYSQQKMQFSEYIFEVIKLTISNIENDDELEIVFLSDEDHNILEEQSVKRSNLHLTNKIINITNEDLNTWGEWMIYTLFHSAEDAIPIIWESVERNIFKEKIKCYYLNKGEYSLPQNSTINDFILIINKEYNTNYNAAKIFDKNVDNIYVLQGGEIIQLYYNDTLSNNKINFHQLIDYRSISYLYKYLYETNQLNFDQINIAITEEEDISTERISTGMLREIITIEGNDRNDLVKDIYAVFDRNSVLKYSFKSNEADKTFQGVIEAQFSNRYQSNQKLLDLMGIRSVKSINIVDLK